MEVLDCVEVVVEKETYAKEIDIPADMGYGEPRAAAPHLG